MIAKINTIEGKFIINTDIIDLRTFKIVITEIKKEWVKRFIRKKMGDDGLIRFIITDKDGNDIHSFREKEYDGMLSLFCNDSDYYTKMPINMISQKFSEKGFICRLTKIEGHSFII